MELAPVIQIAPQMRILMAVQPVDFRRGIDGLARICREALASDPFSGTVFVFRNRRATSIKVLVYDSQGFWLCQKRLSASRFRWWPSGDAEKAYGLAAHQLQTLLWNGDPDKADAAPAWRPLPCAQTG
jgi:transposase